MTQASPTKQVIGTHGPEGGREGVGRFARALQQMQSRGGLKATRSTYGRSFGCSEDVANQRHPIHELEIAIKNTSNHLIMFEKKIAGHADSGLLCRAGHPAEARGSEV